MIEYAKRFFRWGFKPRSAFTAVIIGVVALGLVLFVANRVDATSGYPHGVEGGCATEHFWTYIWEDCHALVQPGTVADTSNWLKIHAGSTTAFIVGGLAGAVCKSGGVIIAALCAVVVGIEVESAVNAFKLATAQHRCVMFTWSIYPPSTAPQRPRVDLYGSAQKWFYDYVSIGGKAWQAWVWRSPNRCQTRQPVHCPSPGGWAAFDIPDCSGATPVVSN